MLSPRFLENMFICFSLATLTAQDLVKWQQKAVPVSEHSVESAVKWLWKLDHMPAISHTSFTEALLEAISDETVEAVYYFTVGDFPKDMKQLLLQKVSNSPYPIHTVSFNAKEEETIIFLKEMSQLTSGRFHAFAERTDYIDLIGPIPKSEEDGESLATQNSRKLKGKVPLVAGVREDVFLIWKELEEARNVLIQLQNILSESDQPISATKTDPPVPEPKPEDYISSKEWLQKNGLKAQKLTLYEALADCTFRHADGVVDIKAKPEDESLQTDAVGSSTNTLKALQIALADSDTQAIYLLTDGRPDQPPKTILAQILLRHKVPIHTISFNCDDTEANKFLHELSTETGGRFHYYNIYVTDPEAPEPIVSEDIYLLKREIEQGERDLEKVQTFHTECLMMNWYNGEKDGENKYVLKLPLCLRVLSRLLKLPNTFVRSFHIDPYSLSPVLHSPPKIPLHSKKCP
uniref:VWFA domain-containing protein n=1 Tax=Chelydra serpentina TaxID=8475 RepID=A0A8C3RJ88_CHESE